MEATGYFDDKMLQAVHEFKKNHELGNTGKWEEVIGPQTWSMLFGARIEKVLPNRVVEKSNVIEKNTSETKNTNLNKKN